MDVNISSKPKMNVYEGRSWETKTTLTSVAFCKVSCMKSFSNIDLCI